MHSYLYSSKYRSVINLSCVADTEWTHMASSMKHPMNLFPGYINEKPYLGRTKTDHVLSEQHGQKWVRILPQSKSFLALRFQLYQCDERKAYFEAFL